MCVIFVGDMCDMICVKWYVRGFVVGGGGGGVVDSHVMTDRDHHLKNLARAHKPGTRRTCPV